MNCCPPDSSTILDFKPLTSNNGLRVRRAAHSVDENYKRKYSNATYLMKNLPINHPWNFMQQANVHCAYCDGAYNQSDHPNIKFEVHFSWLFFAFHRAYLYFYEKILGKLIEDETFALPFWNWDSPEGMTIPAMYTDKSTSLYDELRDASTQPPTITDLNYHPNKPKANLSNLIERNLRFMHRQMMSGGRTAELFLGQPFRSGNEPFQGAGSLELAPHANMHRWTGNHSTSLDMGSFGAAARDPIFFAHHSQIDRLWEVWKGLPGGRRENFNDDDWLDSAFLFWDEDLKLVRIRVRDVLDTRKLGYVYEEVPIQWLDMKPELEELTESMIIPVSSFPATVSNSLVSFNASRSVEKRMVAEEVVVLDGIEFDSSSQVKFDVYISSPAKSSYSVFAGTFGNLPAGHRRIRTRMKVGLSDALKELGAEESETIVVIIKPVSTDVMVTIGAIWIDFSA
ncbi:Catechol oxidase protein [Dioscorea alata]|uniref:Catechol oxidase protein n=1 Tax=Dioscorea alata TaxID=55571 RepID=A0ACB7TZV6_DIOAL|nr:Catechol oxidase protein [Dioscorea alata]